MNKLNKNKVALTFGGFIGGLHAFWALLVALGVAKSYFDWALSMHFLSIPYTVVPFDFVTAIELVVMTSVMGYIIGWLFVFVWNRCHA